MPGITSLQVPMTSYTDQVRAIGGLTNPSEDPCVNDKILKCLPVQRVALFGLCSLRSMMTIFALVEMIIGSFNTLDMMFTIVGTWEDFSVNGTPYVLTLFYLIRCLTLLSGILCLFSIIKLSPEIA
jgi:hypothetical protein